MQQWWGSRKMEGKMEGEMDGEMEREREGGKVRVVEEWWRGEEGGSNISVCTYSTY